MTYLVKYRVVGGWFWHTIKNVKGDLTMVSEGLPVRVFIQNDETRIEIPALTNEFKFGKERYLVILANAEKEANQKIPGMSR